MSRIFVNGSGNAITSALSEDLGITGYPFSILVYCKNNSTNNWQYVYKFLTHAANGDYVASLKEGTTEYMTGRLYQSSDDVLTSSPTALTDDVWFPHLLVCGAATTTLYSLGETDSQATNTWQTMVTPQLFLGSSDGTDFIWGGRLSHLTVWGATELSAGSIASILAADDPAGIDAANQTAYWPFTTSDGTSDLTDERNSIVLVNNGTTYDNDDNPTLNSPSGSLLATRVEVEYNRN